MFIFCVNQLSEKNNKEVKLTVSITPQCRNTELLDYCLQPLSIWFLIKFGIWSSYTVLSVYPHMNQMQRLIKKK